MFWREYLKVGGGALLENTMGFGRFGYRRVE